MKPFQFRLQKILEYKKKIEDEKKNILAQYISEYNRVGQMMQTAHHRKDKIIKAMQSNIHDMNYAHLARESLKGIYQTFENGKKRQEEIQVDIDRAREDFIQARQERKAFDKLREKAYKKYQYQLKKEQQKVLEEAAATLYRKGQLREYEWT